MKKQFSTPVGVPTANLAIQKSRMKLYQTAGQMPTYYLQSGQNFEIELFNPTSDVILAKIHLNGSPITQGGLILNPGQRVFLDRYIDVAKKFLFDTYEVSNTEEVRKAIQDNGDFKVEFYKEYKPVYQPLINTPLIIRNYPHYDYKDYFNQQDYNCNVNTGGYVRGSTTTTINLTDNSNISLTNASLNNTFMDNNLTMDSCLRQSKSITTASFNSSDGEAALSSAPRKKQLRSALSKKIETGRVEMGSDSDQKLVSVNKTFELYPFHTIEYKMLPISQKINTAESLNVKRYCTNCATKAKREHKFCSSCGEKL